MHWIGSFNSKIADPIRFDPGVSDLDLDPIQIHKNRIFDPDRGSFRSDHYITGLDQCLFLVVKKPTTNGQRTFPPIAQYQSVHKTQLIRIQNTI